MTERERDVPIRAWPSWSRPSSGTGQRAALATPRRPGRAGAGRPGYFRQAIEAINATR